MADFDASKLYTLREAAKEGHTLTLGEFNGNLSFTVWPHRNSGQRGPAGKISLTVVVRSMLSDMLRLAIKNVTPETSTHIDMTEYDMKTKQSRPVGRVHVGRDNKNIIYIGIEMAGGPMLKFPFRTGLGVDASGVLEEPAASAALAHTFLNDLNNVYPVLAGMKKPMRDRQGGGGGNSGGYNNRPANNSSPARNSSSDESSDDEIPF